MPAYHVGMFCLVNDKRRTVTAEKVISINKSIEFFLMVTCIIASPIALYLEIGKVTFYRKLAAQRILHYKSVCDEFVKIHGNIL